MKTRAKLFLLSIIGLATGVIGLLSLGGTALADGETYTYSGAISLTDKTDNATGMAGGSIIASGGSFKSNTTFKEGTVPTDAIVQNSNQVQGYTVYYIASSFNLSANATQLSPGCAKVPAIIALKKAGDSTGILYPAKQADSSCNIGLNLTTLGISSNTISFQPNDEAVTQNGYVKALGSSLDEVKTKYYQSLKNAPCSSQGCNDTQWDTYVGQCWTTARANDAEDSRLTNQAIAAGATVTPIDDNADTLQGFSSCLSDDIGGVVPPKDIYTALLDAKITADAVNSAGSDAADAADAAAQLTTPTPPTNTCNVSGVGWIVCPVFNLLASVTDGVYGVIQQLLQTNVQIFDTSSGTYTGWQIARNLANVGFVIVFLIIIFSQISNIGISNYGVKKMLPRLIVAAVLVNASYFVCEIVVDLSNILGSSIDGILKSLPLFEGGTSFWGGSDTLSQITGGILAAGTTFAIAGVVGAIAIYTGLGLLLPVLLGALLAIIVTVFILIARQAIIVLAVVVAPLAFLAMLLPNTENLFKQWRKIFVSMLLLYPMVALLFGGSRVASAILLTALGGTNQGFFPQLAAAAVGVLPLFATPILLKGSLNAIPALGNVAAKLQNRANGLVGNKAKALYNSSDFARGRAQKKQLRENYRTKRYAERAGSEKGSLGKFMANGIRMPGKMNKYASEALARNALSAADEADSKDVAAEQNDMIMKQWDHKKLAEEMQIAYKSGNTVRMRAAQNILMKNESGRRVFHEAVDQIESTDFNKASTQSMQRNIKFNAPDIKSVDAAIDNYGNGAGRSLKDARATFDYTALNDTQLAGQSIENVKLATIDADRAGRMIDNGNLSGMSVAVRERLETIAGRKSGQAATPPAGSGPTPPPAGPPNRPWGSV